MKKPPLDRREAWKKYHHWLYVLILPVYLTGFFLVEQIIGWDYPYMVSYMAIDDLIPFCEWFYLAYVLWYPFMGVLGVYLALTDGTGFKRFMTYIGVSFCSALVLFVLFPNGQDLRPDLPALGRENFLIRAIATLYETDTNTNVCPSLHVVGSMAVVFGIFHSRRLRRTVWLPVAAVVIALLIIASTVFIKQHSILDAIIGIPYGFITYILVYHLPGWIRRRSPSSITAEKA